MPRARRLLTNWSKGEGSPLIEGRPDLAAYFECGRIIENFLLFRQGGLDRRPGLRYIAEVKDSSADTIILPFIVNTSTAYILEMGNDYFRVYRNKSQVLTSAGGSPVEVFTPYSTSQLRAIHSTQSVDVLYTFNPDVPQQRLSRSSDTNWSMSAETYKPPPSYVAQTDISKGASAGANATLTPAATTGNGVIFAASQAVFLEGDVGRHIIFGTARAYITGFGVSAGDTTSPNTHVRADILDAFPNTSPIASGSWPLDGSPQVGLLPNVAYPVGAAVVLTTTSNVPAFRLADVGKYIKIFGGLVKITTFDSVAQVHAEIVVVLSDVATPIVAAPAGAWTLEVPSWDAVQGYPRTGEFFQGRLGMASTYEQPTTFWLSCSDDYENFGEGTLANLAVEYTIASRQINQIEWIGEGNALFIGTSGAEFVAQGKTNTTAIGGDNVPWVQRIDPEGVAPIQPIVLGKSGIFVDRSLLKIFCIAYDIMTETYEPEELTGMAEHILKPGIRLGPIALSVKPDPRLYFVRSDGQLVTLTYYPKQKVVGFTRLVTNGLFESVAVIPGSGSQADQVYVVVQRTIGGVVKRFVEVFESNATELAGRPWTQLETDCASIFTSATPTATVTGLIHLEGATVDVVADGSYRGTAVVAGGQITLQDVASVVEVGLHYDSTAMTMRPAIEGEIIEGLPRAWNTAFVRVKDTLGGTVNGQPIVYPAPALNTNALFTGNRKVTSRDGFNEDGYVTIQQTQPYPMTLLAFFGTLSVGDKD